MKTAKDRFLEFLGEDLPPAPLPTPCSPEGCDVCRNGGHCNLFPECSPDCQEVHKLAGESANYVQPAAVPLTTSQVTVTYTNPEDGGVTTYDLGKVQWDPPTYAPMEQWEAELCTRDGQVIATSYLKAPWYARLFARLLGLEWKWKQVTLTQVSWGGKVVATPCNGL